MDYCIPSKIEDTVQVRSRARTHGYLNFTSAISMVMVFVILSVKLPVVSCSPSIALGERTRCRQSWRSDCSPSLSAGEHIASWSKLPCGTASVMNLELLVLRTIIALELTRS